MAAGRAAGCAPRPDPDDQVRFAAALALLAEGDEDRDGPRAVVRDLVRDPHGPVPGGAAEPLADSDDRTADAPERLLGLSEAGGRLLRLVGS
ncbi:hypothetical protein AB0892_11775 [Streptomyces sp. NPDC005409]|uniref:hypothetical protein n=1 Tax=Streptomyces sp. NPDC005409 TaxID=3155342 RepID=UPI0034529951